MLNLIIDAIGAVCAVILVWCLVRAYLRKAPENNEADSIAVENYLQKITQTTGKSAYDTFCKSAEDWRVSAARIDRDFKIYLSSQSLPYYVKDFVRRSQKHIDELSEFKFSYLTDKRLLIFYTLLTLLFWGGAVFLSLYVIPHILPEAMQPELVPGPP